MNRIESDSIVNRVHVLWDKTLHGEERKVVSDAWWPFLKDLKSDAVHQAIDEIVVKGSPFPPRIGEIRRTAMKPSETPPDPLVAWYQFQARLAAANSGASLPEVHEVVLETMKKIGGGRGMHTNGDREAFCEAYRRQVDAWEAEWYKVYR